MNLSKHFTLAEACKSQVALRHNIDNHPPDEAIENLWQVAFGILEPARAHFGRSIIPSSWFRCPALNARVGGSKNSQHMTGAAVDFEIAGVANRDLAAWVMGNCVFDQIILEFWNPQDPRAGWVHVSLLAAGNRSEIKHTTAGGYEWGLP